MNTASLPLTKKDFLRGNLMFEVSSPESYRFKLIREFKPCPPRYFIYRIIDTDAQNSHPCNSVLEAVLDPCVGGSGLPSAAFVRGTRAWEALELVLEHLWLHRPLLDAERIIRILRCVVCGLPLRTAADDRRGTCSACSRLSPLAAFLPTEAELFPELFPESESFRWTRRNGIV